MQAFVYVLGAATAKGPLTYVGWTHDVAQRLARHNAGKGARFTRGRVWKLLHCEPCTSRRHAMSREWYIKRDRALRKKLAAGLVAEAAASQALSATAPDAARFILEATVRRAPPRPPSPLR